MAHAFVVPMEGHPRVVYDHPSPKPGPGELGIEVSACGLNFADLLMIKGTYQDTPNRPFVPGMEICGRVTAVGEGVTQFTTGERITSFCGSGGLASQTVVDVSRCRAVPEGMSDIVAAGFQIAYGTSHLALTRRARLSRGETLVVLGAAGGVGLTAVEIGHALGARVIAVARGTEKLEIARAAGADDLVDAETDDLRGVLRDLGSADVVYDAVGGTLGEAALRAMKPEGRFLTIGYASGEVPMVKANHLLVKNVDIIGFYWGGYLSFAPELLTDSLGELMDWHAAGRIKPHISHVLPFDQIPEGLELLKSRKATGKVVITL